MRIGIIAALPGELASLVRGRQWQRMPVASGSGIAMWQATRGKHELVAVCAGMGAPAARRAFIAAEYAGSLDMVLSAGWAGALTEAALPGDAYQVSEVIDTQTGERFFLPGVSEPVRLVTTVRVAASPEEKHRLASSYNAALVDMEAAAILRLAQIRDIPGHCFKAVSDGFDADLPDLNPFIDINGKLRMPAFLGHIALRPQFWGGVATLGRNSAAAAKALASAIEQFLMQQGVNA